MYSKPVLCAFNRKKLQQIAKENGVRANQKSSVIITILLEKFQEHNNNAGSDSEYSGGGAKWDDMIWDSEGDESGHADW